MVHTLLGPDHYLPFVAMGRASGWPRSRTLVITAVCGAGHVLGSAVLGVVGVATGLALFEIDALEAWSISESRVRDLRPVAGSCSSCSCSARASQLPTRAYRVDTRIAAGAVLVSCGVGVGLGL